MLNACKRILDILALRKKKYEKGNHMHFMNKALSKEIMVRMRLRNKFLRDSSEENKKVFKTTQILCLTSEKI